MTVPPHEPFPDPAATHSYPAAGSPPTPEQPEPPFSPQQQAFPQQEQTFPQLQQQQPFPQGPPFPHEQLFPQQASFPQQPGEMVSIPLRDSTPAPAPRRRWTLVLAITTALFFILSATMTGLYFAKRAELDAAHSDIKDLRVTLKDSREALKANKADLKDAEKVKRVLARCVDEASEMFDTLDRTGEATTKSAREACGRAELYLD
ncbi:MAG: hypothetical protein ACRDT8_05910 [Micromonosporaceae bacterium]